MANANKAVDLLVRDMDEKCKVRRRDALTPTTHEPDKRVAAFALSYLDAFGYLKRELDQWGGITLSDILDGLVHFQDMFRLPKARSLTVQTVKAMEGRRCGCPDVQRDHLGCKAMQRALGLKLPRWKKDGLTYFVADRVSGPAPESFDAAVRSGFLAWSVYANLSISPAESRETADVVIGVARGPQSNFDGPGGTLAWADMPDGDKALRLLFDADERWTLDPREPGVCLHNVMRHEIGHALGLAHSRVPTALMAASYNPAVRDPQQEDDVARLLARYGVEAAAPPAPPQTVDMPVRLQDAMAALQRAGYKVSVV